MELFFISDDDDFFIPMSPELLESPFLVDIFFELLVEVVVLVSLLFAQEARNATPRRQTMAERMDFFIGLN